MNAAEVDDQTIVDEDPDVVVASELEDFAAAIREVRVQLEREVIIVTATLVAEELPVDREERVRLERVNSRTRCSFAEYDRNDCLQIHCRIVVVPLVEAGGARDRAAAVWTNEDRLLIRAELGLDQAGDESGNSLLEVGMRVFEVAHCGVQHDG